MISLSYLVDLQRVRQYMDRTLFAMMLWEATQEDRKFLGQVRRGFLPLPFDGQPEVHEPFPPLRRRRIPKVAERRVAIVATGGSGALAATVGVARALEEAGSKPVAYGVCSGSAFFGVPLAAGMPPDEVAEATLALRPRDILDPDWRGLLTAPLRLGRGWAGVMHGERIEETFRRIVGDVTLGELPTPIWMPIWNIEHNRLEYLGPDTHPDLPAARAVRMAVALPLAIQPVEMDGLHWLDGGIVDVLPAQPFLGTDRCDLAVVVNCFYPPGFESETEETWRDSTFSVLHVANQTRTMQHLQVARQSMADLRRAVPHVIELEPVEYSKVHGAGLYGQFLDTREWAGFMVDGHRAATEALKGFRPASTGGRAAS